MKKKLKIGLVTSRGGHLFQLYQLKDWWKNYDRFWITGRGGDSDYLLKGEKVYYAFFPESRNIFNAVRNFFFGLKVLLAKRPNLLISCGAGIAPPVFLAGKILGAKLIFIEPYDFIKYPSLSGRLVYPLVDKMLVQHLVQKKFYSKTELWGATL